jgi:pyruvate oxidase
MGPGAFQEIDLASAFEAVAGFSQTVLPGSRHGELAALALKTAIVDRGVAHLILPDEVQVLDAGDSGPVMNDGRLSPTAVSPPEQSLDFASYRIARARRPVIIVGYGAREAMGDILALAEALGSPVITTFKAKGQVSDRHPSGAGVLGRSGTPVASGLMSRADLLVVFGASFSNHTGIATDKPIIQVDFDRMALGRFHGVDEPVSGRRRDGCSNAWTRIPDVPTRGRSWPRSGRPGAGRSATGLPATTGTVSVRRRSSKHWVALFPKTP